MSPTTMFKRLNRHFDKGFGSPSSIDTAFPNQSVERVANVNNGDFSLSSRPAFGRSKTDDVLKGLPELPLYVRSTQEMGLDHESLFSHSRSLEPPAPPTERPYSETPTVSSVSSMYSQPSPSRRKELAARLEVPRASSVYPDDVSPPDTPRTSDGAHSKKQSPNVSPVADTTTPSPPPLQLSRKFASNIPVPHNVPSPNGTPTLFASLRERAGRVASPEQILSKSTRWDAYSGEPTTNQAGRPAQAAPGTENFEAQWRARDRSLKSSAQSNGGSEPKNMFGERLRIRTSGKRGMIHSPPVREPWKGASGRSTIVKPLADKPLPPGKAPTFPEGNQSRLSRRALTENQSPPTPSPLTDRTSQQNSLYPSKVSEEDLSIRPLVPLKIRRNSPHTSLPNSPTISKPAASRPSDPDIDDTRSPLARNPSNEEMNGIPEEESSESTPRDSRIEAPAEAPRNEPRTELDNEPPSRFSTTTYATTVYDSPPGTPRKSSEVQTPEVPPVPKEPIYTSPILNRKRPVPPAGVLNNKAAARKPTPSETDSTMKTLPRSPAEINAVDRVASLEAKLDNLRRRRGNLQTVIHELTHVVQPSSIAYDMASRQEIKKTVEGLHAELAEVNRDEHETGLKLHRALKKRDEDTMYEPTGLWVRRVTS